MVLVLLICLGQWVEEGTIHYIFGMIWIKIHDSSYDLYQDLLKIFVPWAIELAIQF